MKPKTKREKELVSIAYSTGYGNAKCRYEEELRKTNAELSKQAETKARFEAETKLLNAIGQSYEALARAVNAIQHY